MMRIDDRHSGTRPDAGDVIALALSIVWVLAILIPMIIVGADALGAIGIVAMAAAAVVPVALFWMGAAAARTAAAMRRETAELRAALAALSRPAAAPTRPAPPPVAPLPEAPPAPEPPDAPAPLPETVPTRATFSSSRPAGYRLPAQGELALRDERAPEPISTDEFLSALDFPISPEDGDGFRAMRRALADRSARQLVRASQDVLTLLSQEGIYMDDLTPDRSRPEIWRRFAQGERGRTVAPLGGIRDRTSLTLTSTRMRNDPIFRDAAHHFLRIFDRTLAEFEPRASDGELVRLADTRTGRAFMLIGRVTGTFD